MILSSSEELIIALSLVNNNLDPSLHSISQNASDASHLSPRSRQIMDMFKIRRLYKADESDLQPMLRLINKYKKNR